MNEIRVAIAGLGNCAGSLIEALSLYKNNTDELGFIFEKIGGYLISDIRIVCAFDIADGKVGKTVSEAIYSYPNNFNRFCIPNIDDEDDAPVYMAEVHDGNPDHLAIFVKESTAEPINIVDTLHNHNVDVLLNLLPTGSHEATHYYGEAAYEAGVAFINCIPTKYAQQKQVADRFKAKGIAIIGDDVKSQVGSTMLHRALLDMLHERGANIMKSSQINIGGNSDFANFVHRAESKLVSKKLSLAYYLDGNTECHLGHHYDVTKGAFKKTLFDIQASVFGGSTVKIQMILESDDKPNCAGSIVDMIRIAKTSMDRKAGGLIEEACLYYCKSYEIHMTDSEARKLVQEKWV